MEKLTQAELEYVCSNDVQVVLRDAPRLGDLILRMAEEILAHRHADATRVQKRGRLEELLGADSTNFLGTGLSLVDFMKLYDAEALSRAWTLQSRVEKKRRLRAVQRLSVELARMSESVHFATGLAEMAIEAVIEGDWKMVAEWATHLTFDEKGRAFNDPDQRGTFAEIHAVFRELLLQALRAEKEV